jgi:hypothetical protein
MCYFMIMSTIFTMLF